MLDKLLLLCAKLKGKQCREEIMETLTWKRLKEMSPTEIGNLSWRPNCDLPDLLYILIQRIKQLENKE